MTRQQKITVITGASKGIGLALARQLYADGQQVIGLARHGTDHFPGQLYEVDLSNSSETHSVAQQILSTYGQVDHLINNVGLVKPAKLGDIKLDDFDAVMNLNLKPALILSQAFLPGMKQQHNGRIVNISSLVTLGMPERTAYAAAKSALISFTRSWALELAKDGITVNAIAPGPTETELFRANNRPGSEGEKRYLAAVPMGRFAKPEEIAAAIRFFLAESSGIITGQTLFVDGGASVGKQQF
ncbi:MAG: SDR family oxidoreductase [Burkholderiaceae bacterium]|nr:SDR family oxidoreductase [Burkholderiaceae bacterium]